MIWRNVIKIEKKIHNTKIGWCEYYTDVSTDFFYCCFAHSPKFVNFHHSDFWGVHWTIISAMYNDDYYPGERIQFLSRGAIQDSRGNHKNSKIIAKAIKKQQIYCFLYIIQTKCTKGVDSLLLHHIMRYTFIIYTIKKGIPKR